MKRFKRITSIIIAASIIWSYPVYAADNSQIQSAWSLYSMGLFNGTGTNEDGTPIFELDSEITRAQAVVLIVNLTGKTNEAENGNWNSPFSDLPEWAENYIEYAYNAGFVGGLSDNVFSPDSKIDANQFCAFILRVLGYSEDDGDFEYSGALSFAYEKGIAKQSYSGFTRGDAAEICYNALYQTIKNSSSTLYDSLANAGAISVSKNSLSGISTAIVNNTDKTELTAEEIYEICSPAVFYIEVYDESGQAIQLGSGFFIDSDGTAVTNYHVLDGGSSAKITLSDSGKVYNVEGVYDYDKDRDIALIKIEGSGFSYLETDNSDNIKGGATVYAIGSPLGLSNTISQGIISNTDRTIDGNNYIQISAAISNGSSGGALINTAGKVIGITSGEAAQSTRNGTVTGQNLNLAIPINSIKELSKNTLTSMADIYEKEIKENSKIEVTAENVTVEKGKYTTVTVRCESDVEAFLTGSLSESGIISAKFRKQSGGATIIITGIKSGDAQINLKLRTSSGSIITEKTINVTVE